MSEALHDREMHRRRNDEAHLDDSSTSISKSSHAGDLESFIEKVAKFRKQNHPTLHSLEHSVQHQKLNILCHRHLKLHPWIRVKRFFRKGLACIPCLFRYAHPCSSQDDAW
ncbi:hypothetical protein EUGRSUZ_H03632 [Eucalyptus grandis]|uniref:Uncharacterized protein n=2 Tax=Eucalyptus grandis TaxID=71139 RepID=A0ACC3JUG0_EUCGR|nr:hypothetical protein EUGRSUZ_H03632 [Eucalyptus grandis]